MAEFEELVLSVRVDDQASAKLEQLKRSVADLGSGSQAAGFERFKRQTQDLDRINCRPALKALAPTSGISGAPLPKVGSFLNHDPTRSA